MFTLSDVLETLNLARAANGLDELHDLPSGVPGDLKHSVIAHALQVPSGSVGSFMVFSDADTSDSNEYGRKLAKAWGAKKRSRRPPLYVWAVLLPPVLQWFQRKTELHEITSYDAKAPCSSLCVWQRLAAPDPIVRTRKKRDTVV